MSTLKSITRRTFLVGSAAIAGGVAFGVYNVKKPHDNPLLQDVSDGEATFNPWVLISKEKVTLVVPHMDMGQGVASVQAALIAEEMDIEFGQFDIDFGKPAGAYYNRATGDEMVPFLSTDRSFQAETMRNLVTGIFKLIGSQGTGGSTSVPDSFIKLREAGATARETLKLAAAKKTGIAIDKLKTSNGAVHLPDGSSLNYTELAETASTIKPVLNVPLRDPATWRLIGKQMKRLDIVGKSTGTLDYGIDLEIEDMVHAAVRINPRKGAPLKDYDASAAENMRGVIRIVGVTNGLAVIADNTWRAFRAANSIQCTWADAPYPSEQQQHWQEIKNSFIEERLDKEWRNEGNVEQELASGSDIEAEYRAPYVAHQPLEPIGAIVKVTDHQVDIWAGHQIPGFAQQKVADITGHDLEQVFIHNQFVGGSFGHRLEFENVTLAAEIAKQMPNTPVKLTFTREEDFSQDFTRQIGMARGKGSVKDGQVNTTDIQIATVSSSASQSSRLGLAMPGPDIQIAAGAWNLPYSIPNFRVRAYRVPELAPTSSWRSVGASTAGFFADSFLDEMIHKAGADPLAERLRLCNHDVARKVLETAGEISDWGSPMEANQGRGIALVESFGVPVAEVIEVTNTKHGIKIDKVFVVVDVGKIVDPVNFDNLVKGGVVWGLGHAMNCEITYADGKVSQTNYHSHEGMRMHQCPEIIVKGLENADKIRGIGEPPVPPAAPALANAIFAATGKRIREMPFNKHIEFV